jgi:hypothetical protein
MSPAGICARAAYRALRRKYVGPPRAAWPPVVSTLQQERFHDLQAELP